MIRILIPSKRKPKRLRQSFVALVGLSFLLGGCSSETVTQAIDSAKQAAAEMGTQAVEQIDEVLPESGSVTLQGSQEVIADRAEVRLHKIGDGRSSAIQLTTYDPEAATLRYPAICIHGPTSLQSLDDIGGATIPCEMFVQVQTGAPVAMSTLNQPVQVSFGRVDKQNNTIGLSIQPSRLQTSDGKIFDMGGGEAIAVIKETN